MSLEDKVRQLLLRLEAEAKQFELKGEELIHKDDGFDAGLEFGRALGRVHAAKELREILEH